MEMPERSTRLSMVMLIRQHAVSVPGSAARRKSSVIRENLSDLNSRWTAKDSETFNVADVAGAGMKGHSKSIIAYAPPNMDGSTSPKPLQAETSAGPERNEVQRLSAPSESSGPPEAAGNKRKRDGADQSNRSDARSRGSRKQRKWPKSKEVSRGEQSASTEGVRNRLEESRRKNAERPDYKPPVHSVQFSKEEIEAEERRPKKKVAVMVGYAGTGYFGMQLNHDQKTIEGDLFQAFVKAGAISKANADEPKKVSFIRCARTDKGVHAAGNIISLKLVVEDQDIVQKINEHLVPQIRVWGIERTLNSFSAYTNVDSRIYEYLIPTHCFLPPHPKTYLGKQLAALAEEMSDLDAWEERQRDTADFWKHAEDNHIRPVLDKLDPELRDVAWEGIFDYDEANAGDIEGNLAEKSKIKKSIPSTKLEEAKRSIREAIVAAKKAWRITPERLARVKSVFSRFEGVHNFHNYTIRMRPKDPSAKRVIKSFVVNETPTLINGTEWLSMKVHGQSFMMHQIRKMVGMATLTVRCGTHEGRLQDSMDQQVISIPKVPGLGLLLERPVFDTYNKRLKTQRGNAERSDIGFEPYKEQMDEFKQREIYDRIFREEADGNDFHNLFWSIDSLKKPSYLYLSSKGLEAVGKGNGHDGDNDSALLDALGDSDEDEPVKNEGN